MPRVVKSWDEIFSRWGYCDNHDLSRLDNQSIERDRLIGIGFVLNFVKFISFTFGDKEMISVIEAIIREVFVKLLLDSFGKLSISFHFSILYIDTMCCDDIHSCLRLAVLPWRGVTDHTIDFSPIPTLRIHKEVYVQQPSGFVDPAHPNKVYKVIKALCGLHQAPRAWYETLSTFLLENGFRRGTIDKTLFIKKNKSDIITATTPIESNKPLVQDKDGVDVDVHVYRFQVTPKASHLNAIKRIFRYLKHQPKLELWYPRDSPFEVEGYLTDSGLWKNRLIVSNTSLPEAEYVLLLTVVGKYLWIQKLTDRIMLNFMNSKIHIDNESTIYIVKNPVYHSRTKHIEIRHHFIRDCYEKRLIAVVKIHTDNNVADLLTKGFDVTRFNFLVNSMHIENGLKLWPIISLIFVLYALTHNLTIYDSLVKQFWQTATVRTLANGTPELVASIDNKEYTITEASVRSKLQLADVTSISNLPDVEIYDVLATLGFLQMILGITTKNNGKYLAPTLTKKLFANRNGEMQGISNIAGLLIGSAAEDQVLRVLFSTIVSYEVNHHRSHEAPLHEGHTSGSAEDSLQLKELMVLVVVSDSKDEETENQGRKIQDINDDPLVSLVRESMKEKDIDFVTPTKISASGEVQEQILVLTTFGKQLKLITMGPFLRSQIYPGSKDFNTGNEDFNTGSLGVSTGSGPVSTPKEIQATKRTKAQIQQEEAGNKKLAEGHRLTMFDPPLNEDAIWSLPLQQKMVSWRYYDKCEVHCLTLEACTIYMLADRKYPLSKEACQVMLKMKLLDGKMNEVCYKLLKMIEKQAGIRK
ncbi:putative ribonuclease H-like domain-containing protein [Tanacetum coccineum]